MPCFGRIRFTTISGEFYKYAIILSIIEHIKLKMTLMAENEFVRNVSVHLLFHYPLNTLASLCVVNGLHFFELTELRKHENALISWKYTVENFLKYPTLTTVQHLRTASMFCELLVEKRLKSLKSIVLIDAFPS